MSAPEPEEHDAARWRSAQGAATAVLGLTYAILWIGGVLTYAFGAHAPVRASLVAPAFLSLALVLVLVLVPRRHASRIALAGMVGWAAEVIGANTGVPFGAYTYGEALGVKLGGAPLVIMSAWAVLGVSAVTVMRAVPTAAVATLAAAAWLVVVDLVLDPVASGPLAFWTWHRASGFHGVPLTNFAGWFVVGGAVCGILRRVEGGPAAATVGLSLVVFFAAIALAQGLRWPAAIGLGLAALSTVALARRPAGAGEVR